MNQINAKILFFGVAKELMNSNGIEVKIAEEWKSVNDLIEFICNDLNPKLSILTPFVALALNEEYLIEKDKSIKLEDKSVLAVIPPINGG